MARFKRYLDPLSLHQLKNVVRVGHPLTKFFGSALEWALLKENLILLLANIKAQICLYINAI